MHKVRRDDQINTIVVYKSRTGFTKRYAQWIGDALGCKIADYNDINKLDLDSFDLIIYGGRVHAGKIDGLDKVTKLLENKNCKFIVFVTGATPLAATKEIEKTMSSNFANTAIPHFYMQSGLCYEKMGIVDKFMMKMLSKMLSSKENKSDIENGAAVAISKSHDISDKGYIKPLIDHIRKMEKKEIATQDDLLTVLALLDKAKVQYWLDGGWGVDVLAGRQTREHRDIDINFDARFTKKLLEILKAQGYEIAKDLRPVRIELYHAEHSYIDIHPFILNEDRTAKQADLEGGFYAFEADIFGSAVFHGREVPCISVKGQKLFHTGYELRAVDRLDIAILDTLAERKA